MRQHRVGALPAEPVEQLERLLRVDRAVAVRQEVIADHGGEPRPQLVGGPAGVDGAADQRLGRRELLGLDEAAELGAGVAAELGRRVRQLVDRPVALDLGDPGDALHDRQGPLVAVVEVDHRQAVGGRRDRVTPAELGARRAVGDGLPDQLARVGVGPQQPDDVPGDLAHVVVLDARGASWP